MFPFSVLPHPCASGKPQTKLIAVPNNESTRKRQNGMEWLRPCGSVLWCLLADIRLLSSISSSRLDERKPPPALCIILTAAQPITTQMRWNPGAQVSLIGANPHLMFLIDFDPWILLSRSEAYAWAPGCTTALLKHVSFWKVIFTDDVDWYEAVTNKQYCLTKIKSTKVRIHIPLFKMFYLFCEIHTKNSILWIFGKLCVQTLCWFWRSTRPSTCTLTMPLLLHPT